MRFYKNITHEVVKLSLDNLRASRFWEAQAMEAYEADYNNHYGISYASSKAEAFKNVAYGQFRISQLMRSASNTRIKRLYKQALILEEEAWRIDNR
jgi:hypothetical protein